MQKQTSWTPRIMPWSARSYFAVPMGHKIYFHTPDTRLPVQQTVHNNNNNLTSIVTAIYSHSHCCICRREFVIVLNQLHVYSLSGLVWWLNVLIWKLLSKSSLFKSQGIRGVQFSLWILSAEMSITATERRVVWPRCVWGSRWQSLSARHQHDTPRSTCIFNCGGCWPCKAHWAACASCLRLFANGLCLNKSQMCLMCHQHTDGT